MIYHAETENPMFELDSDEVRALYKYLELRSSVMVTFDHGKIIFSSPGGGISLMISERP